MDHFLIKIGCLVAFLKVCTERRNWTELNSRVLIFDELTLATDVVRQCCCNALLFVQWSVQFSIFTALCAHINSYSSRC